MLIGCLLVVAASAAAAAQDGTKAADQQKRLLYQWVGDDGVVHMTDELQKVPEQYRNKARIIEQSPAGTPKNAGQQPAALSPLSSDEYQKIIWQQRMAAARNRRSAAEARYLQLVRDRDLLQEQWGYGLYGYPSDVSRRLEEINAQIVKAKRDLDDAEQAVEVSIPEEARKAGIPPGWLRE